MNQENNTNQKIITLISENLQLNSKYVVNAVNLFEDGSTLPFIARYRKEMIGGIDEVVLKDLKDLYYYQVELADRKVAVLKSIEEQNKMTPELKEKIIAAETKQLIEDIYLPFRPKRKTKASIAREQGLEPVAIAIHKEKDYESIIQDILKSSDDANLTAESCLQGALFIIAESVLERAEIIGSVRDQSTVTTVLLSEVKEEFAEKKTKYIDYYDFRESLSKIPAHRLLAIRRGEKEKFLKVTLELPDESNLEYIKREFIPLGNKNSQLLIQAVEDAYTRLITPQLIVELRMAAKRSADEESIKIFCENMKNLLLGSYGGDKVVLGIDPGFRTGSKIVVVDETGKLLDHATIHPLKSTGERETSEKIVDDFMNRHPFNVICIGNGTASREVYEFMENYLDKRNKQDIHLMYVNEAGASVYSASEISRREFPDLDLTYRGSVSIARRFQDPLAELVKIDPKSIGVGQYQHDVSQTLLKQALDDTVEHCVNFVGVNLNTASAPLLSRVAGLNYRQSEQIVSFRDSNGSFHDRSELLKVPGLGAKTFEQCAGFLRIPDGSNPLDATAVHPESYQVVRKISEELEIDLSQLIKNEKMINSIPTDKYINTITDKYTLSDILEELKKPGRDPRDEYKMATLNKNIKTIQDLKSGMTLEGTITNLTKFGAFVDIGVHRDGLIHLSEMSEKFIESPQEVCKVGQIVKVRVVDIDTQLERIGLSMILTPQNNGKKKNSKRAKPAAPNNKEANTYNFNSVEEFTKKFNSRFSK